jgi:uncharacterized protein with FMN-binding domain
MGMNQVVRRAAAIAFAACCLCILAACSVDKQALAKSIDLRDVDLSKVADGVYEASYTINPPVMAANKTASVKVTVGGGAYQSIEIVKPEVGKDKMYVALVDGVKRTGRLSIDAVSGATVTGAAVLKAVQLAVGGGK